MGKMIERVKDWLLCKVFLFRTGIPIRVANQGRPIEQIVIRYKDYFFMIDMDTESGKPTGDFGWSEGQAMTPVPIREFYIANREESNL